MKFQVEVTLSARGYVELEAADATAARKKVRALEVGLDFPMFSEGGLDTTLMDSVASIHVDGVVPVEDET